MLAFLRGLTLTGWGQEKRAIHMRFLLKIIGILTLAISGAFCGEATKSALGFQGGISTRENFIQLELTGNRALPWEWETARFRAGLVMNGTMGVLDGLGDTAFITTLGPGLVFGPKEGRYHLDLGSSATLLSREKFGHYDLGLIFQFASHVGINFKMGESWTTGYRFQHMSNAGLGRLNPGLDVHMLRLHFHF
jgi:hypothetical protein